MNPLERVAAWADDAAPPPSPGASSNGFDLPGFIQRHEQLQVRKQKSLPDGTTLYELQACPFNADHTKGSAFITQGADGKLGFRCYHNSCVGKKWKELRASLEPDYQSRVKAYGSQWTHQSAGTNSTAKGVGETNQKAAREQTEDACSLVTRRVADIAAEPVSWLWEGRIARGKVTIIAGDPGLGKSQTTASIAAVVTTGGQWPVTRERCELGDVLFLTAEDDPADTLRPRLEAAGANLGRVPVIDGVIRGYTGNGDRQTRAFSLQEDLRALEAELAQRGNVAVVVIDPISAYLGGVDSHKNAEVRALLAPLSELASRHNVAIIVISHLNKAGAAQAMMRITGSLAFVAAARAAYLVAADPADKERRLFLSIKNNLAKEPGGLAFRIEGASVASSAGPLATSRVMWEFEPVTITADEVMQSDAANGRCTAVDEATEWLRETLADGPMPSSEIFERGDAEGFSKRTLKRAARGLGIKPTKAGMRGGWSWSLSKGAKSPEECQEKSLAPFGTARRASGGRNDRQPAAQGRALPRRNLAAARIIAADPERYPRHHAAMGGDGAEPDGGLRGY